MPEQTSFCACLYRGQTTRSQTQKQKNVHIYFSKTLCSAPHTIVVVLVGFYLHSTHPNTDVYSSNVACEFGWGSVFPDTSSYFQIEYARPTVGSSNILQQHKAFGFTRYTIFRLAVLLQQNCFRTGVLVRLILTYTAGHCLHKPSVQYYTTVQ